VARDGPDALDIVGLAPRSSVPPAIWAASGHLETFTDPLVDCKKVQRALARGQDRRRLSELRLYEFTDHGPST